MRVLVDREDVQRLTDKLSIQGWSAVLRRLLERIGHTVERYAKQRAPVRHGTLRRDIRSKVDPSTPPRFVDIGTRVMSGGVSYPAVLEAGEDKRGRIFHYRTHPLFGGQPTEGWLKQHTMGDARPHISGQLGRAGSEIKDDWERR